MTALVKHFQPIPSWDAQAQVTAAAAPVGEQPADVVGVPVAQGGEIPGWVGRSWDQLKAAGFDGKVGQALAVAAADGPALTLYGIGEPGTADAAALRDAAAGFARAASRQSRLAVLLPDRIEVPPDHAAQAVVEGVLLARYSYQGVRRETATTAVDTLTVLAAPEEVDAAQRGAKRGAAYAAAAAMARDLANAPPSLLTAARMAECAQSLAADSGLQVEVFDRAALLELGCGGLLGVNAGSVDEPRMIKLRYEPAAGAETRRLTLVGKGVMYDSGGIALKPADAVHATMKNDMSGAGAILAAMAVLRRLDCPVAVTGYLMCTDNMPSGSATKLGDVLAIRGGMTVEVVNTDAEGRLVMADALVLATEEPTDAIVDIATLTGACMRALGTQIAGVLGNDQALIDQVVAAAGRVDEPVWQLPLAHRYRREMDSHVADIKNMGGPNGAAIHAALFLEEFVGGKPWAHIDIAGTAQNESATGWQSPGCSGFGARLLVDLVSAFSPTR